MKNSILILAFSFVLFGSSLVQAQDFMDRFYQPSKVWQDVQGLDHDLHLQRVGKDTISYLEVRPEGKAKGTVIYFHGAGGNISTYVPLTEPLVKDGYRIFLVDFRGYGHSTGKPNHRNVAEDAQLIYDKITRLRETRRKDIIIYGASLGSQVASKIALDNADQVDALILDGPMTSFTDIALAYTEEKDHGYVKMFVRSPYSAKECLPQLTDMPLLLIHSEEDEGVPFSMGKELFASKKGVKDMWIYEGAHLQAPVLFPEELVSRIDGMLREL